MKKKITPGSCFLIGFTCVFVSERLWWHIDFFPDFIGHLLLVHGFRQLRDESGHFETARLFSRMLIPVTALVDILYFLNLSFDSLPGLLVNLLIRACTLYVLFCFNKGLSELEQSRGRELGAKRLRDVWPSLLLVYLGTILAAPFSYRAFYGLRCATAVALCLLIFYLLKTAQALDSKEQ